MIALKENYYALILTIMNPRQSAESAIARFLPVTGDGERRSGRMKPDKEEIAEMVRLKKSMTFKELSELYGLSPGAIQKRMQRHGRG